MACLRIDTPSFLHFTVYYRKTILCSSSVFNLVNNSLESGGIVESEVSENFTVDFDTCLVDKTHKFRV